MTTDTGVGAGLGPDGSSSDEPGSDDAGARERAQQTASTAADEGKHVANVAVGEAKGVAAEATSQARDLLGEARGHVQGQLDEQGHAAKKQAAGTLSTLSDDLGSMAENGSGLAAQIAHEVAERVGSLSRHLEDRQPSELVDDVRSFARQRPGMFLVGALAAGVVVGRLARGAKDAIEAAEGDAPATGTQIGDRTPVTPAFSDTTARPASYDQLSQPAPATTPPAGSGYPVPTSGSDLTPETGTPQGPLS